MWSFYNWFFCLYMIISSIKINHVQKIIKNYSYNQVDFLKFYFQLEDNYFIILCWFLPFITWISHRYTHIPSLHNLPPHPTNWMFLSNFTVTCLLLMERRRWKIFLGKHVGLLQSSKHKVNNKRSWLYPQRMSNLR